MLFKLQPSFDGLIYVLTHSEKLQETVFWQRSITPDGEYESSQTALQELRFCGSETSYCSLQATLKMESTCSSEILVFAYKTIRCGNPEILNMNKRLMITVSLITF
jgi:hypothetical protein